MCSYSPGQTHTCMHCIAKSHCYTLSGAIFESMQGIMLATQRAMWPVSNSQKNRKNIKIIGMSASVFDYLHCKYWCLAEEDSSKQQRNGKVPVRSSRRNRW